MRIWILALASLVLYGCTGGKLEKFDVDEGHRLKTKHEEKQDALNKGKVISPDTPIYQQHK